MPHSSRRHRGHASTARRARRERRHRKRVVDEERTASTPVDDGNEERTASTPVDDGNEERTSTTAWHATDMRPNHMKMDERLSEAGYVSDQAWKQAQQAHNVVRHERYYARNNHPNYVDFGKRPDFIDETGRHYRIPVVGDYREQLVARAYGTSDMDSNAARQKALTLWLSDVGPTRNLWFKLRRRVPDFPDHERHMTVRLHPVGAAATAVLGEHPLNATVEYVEQQLPAHRTGTCTIRL